MATTEAGGYPWLRRTARTGAKSMQMVPLGEVRALLAERDDLAARIGDIAVLTRCLADPTTIEAIPGELLVRLHAVGAVLMQDSDAEGRRRYADAPQQFLGGR